MESVLSTLLSVLQAGLYPADYLTLPDHTKDCILSELLTASDWYTVIYPVSSHTRRYHTIPGGITVLHSLHSVLRLLTSLICLIDLSVPHLMNRLPNKVESFTLFKGKLNKPYYFGHQYDDYQHIFLGPCLFIVCPY